ncbi:hypothetical protein BV22DRAFT_1173280, partial [Leucogyrophana mollusca]
RVQSILSHPTPRRHRGAGGPGWRTGSCSRGHAGTAPSWDTAPNSVRLGVGSGDAREPDPATETAAGARHLWSLPCRTTRPISSHHHHPRTRSAQTHHRQPTPANGGNDGNGSEDGGLKVGEKRPEEMGLVGLGGARELPSMPLRLCAGAGRLVQLEGATSAGRYWIPARVAREVWVVHSCDELEQHVRDDLDRGVRCEELLEAVHLAVVEELDAWDCCAWNCAKGFLSLLGAGGR